ncbi:CBS domain-containing protein [Metallosphaera tengchongensis]|uniref:CBS domain-containing protein n=1 Tax=Metallosphaera tengchongensis TaxID=1532350 RepID=A0A6N0NTC2_9CREN|nr:CBS domain-containing protein [Metallosphaera tengchongensis]QKR00104.1 CBS domain-containing protein [Metallosphaera tengchongensis]
MTKVADVMSPVVVSLSVDAKAKELIEVLAREKSGRVIITKDEKPEGIVTTRGIVRAYVEYGRNLLELKIKDLIREKLISSNVNDSLQDVIRKMISFDIGGVPVMDGDIIVGIFTERDLVKFMSTQVYSGLVDSIMSQNVVEITGNVNTLEASKLMVEHGVRRLPIVIDGQLKGIVTAADIVKSLSNSIEPRPVLEVGTRNPITVRRLDTIMKVVKIMDERRIGTLPVVEDRLVGIVTERDLLYAAINSVN